MSDFNTDFNMGNVPQPAEPAQVQTDNALTADQEYEKYPLGDNERAQVEEFARKIDLYDSQTVLQYASGTQKQIADFVQMQRTLTVLWIV